MRRGVTLFGMVVLVAALAAAVARADGGDTGTTTTGTTETTDTTTTVTTTTETTTTTAPAAYVPLLRSRLPLGCVGAGVAAITKRHHAAVALDLPDAGRGASAYPASNPFLTFDSAAATSSGCRNARLRLTNVSLFGGAVTATAITVENGRAKVTGLALDGSPVALKAGQTVAVGSWGLLERGAKNARLSAPLALRLVHGHDSLPARTTIYLGFTARRTTHPQEPRVPEPLTATPGLGYKTRHYVLPVDGGASYVDTYAADRNDIYDGWHHGDDLFAPLGTPVVAVANGTLSPIGWNAIGGWRLWLTDNKGNSFYYAHLAGYSRHILHHRTVEAGQVIGFLGRTGDAFTTPPHLHFEIHPHQFVKLGYDGAVDPTRYLDSWRVVNVPTNDVPPAARLRAPAGQPSEQAAVVWQELLKARHLMPDGEPVVALTRSVRRPYPAARETTPFVDTQRLASPRLAGEALPKPPGPWPLVTLGLGVAAFASAGSFAVVRRRRSS